MLEAIFISLKTTKLRELIKKIYYSLNVDILFNAIEKYRNLTLFFVTFLNT